MSEQAWLIEEGEGAIHTGWNGLRKERRNGDDDKGNDKDGGYVRETGMNTAQCCWSWRGGGEGTCAFV